MKRGLRLLAAILLLLSIAFVLGSDAIGAVVGISDTADAVMPFAPVLLILVAVLLFAEGQESLEDKVKNWKKFRINRDSIIADIEQNYIQAGQAPGSASVTSEEPDGEHVHAYKDRFYEGHSAMGGRVIDVPGHIRKVGHQKGKLMHFNKPANGNYVWIVDDKQNFIVGSRQIMEHELPEIGAPLETLVKAKISGGEVVLTLNEKEAEEQGLTLRYVKRELSHIIGRTQKLEYDSSEDIKLRRMSLKAEDDRIFVKSELDPKQVLQKVNARIRDNSIHSNIDFYHKLHKLPHTTLSRGRRIIGSGEVLIENGMVRSFNTASGHYVDRRDIKGFNKQGEEVFREFSKKVGWKGLPGAKYTFKEFE